MSPLLGSVPGKKCETCGLSDVREVSYVPRYRYNPINGHEQPPDCCYGHYGHIDLGCYFAHPLFKHELIEMFERICPSCQTIVNREVRVCLCGTPLAKGFFVDESGVFISKVKKGLKTSGTDSVVKTGTTYSIDHVRSSFLDCGLTGYSNMVIRYVLVSSIPSKSSFSTEWPPFGLNALKWLIQAVSDLKERMIVRSSLNQANRSEKKFDSLLLKDAKKVMNCLNRMMGITKGSEGILKELSGKDGILRSMSHGKRVDMSCRYVIVGDPSIDPRYVLIPKSATKYIKRKVLAQKSNFGELVDLASRGRLFQIVPLGTKAFEISPWQIHLGNVYARDVRDGDVVLLNRQPTLSMTSVMSVRVKVRTDDVKTMSINPLIATVFGADFDGDEMNIYSLSGIQGSKSDRCMSLLSIESCVRKEHGRSSIAFVQDTIFALFMMTRRGDDGKFAETCSKQCYDSCKSAFWSYGYKVDKSSKKTEIKCLPCLYGRELYSVSLFLICLPSGLFNRFESIENVPVIDKKKLRPLLDEVYLYGGGDAVCEFAQKVQIASSVWLLQRGCSVEFRLPNAEIREEEAKRILEPQREISRLRNNSEVASKASMKGTDIAYMIESGSKGSVVNLAQMVSSLGQQYVSGSRPEALEFNLPSRPYRLTSTSSLSGALVHDSGISLKQRGYCYSSYSSGLSAQEFVFHQMAAREGVINTSVTTSETGYLSRRGSIMTSTVSERNAVTVARGRGKKLYYIGG